MSTVAGAFRKFVAITEPFFVLVRWVTWGLLVICGLAILSMMGVTVVSVVLRNTGRGGIAGDLDIIEMLVLVVVATGLPYTTAVKGHIAIEYFFHKLNRVGRILVDTIIRLIGIALFVALAIGSFKIGTGYREAGQVSMTLQMPIWWMPILLGVCSLVIALIILYHLLHPGKEMIKP